MSAFVTCQVAMGRALAAGAGSIVMVGSLVLGAQQQPRFDERVDVARTIIDARVLDDRGDPIGGLTAGDFAVTIDGTPVRVETAAWIGQIEHGDDAPAFAGSTSVEHGAAAPPGRLIVFLFQKDLEPSRIVGLMRMLLNSRNLIGTLTSADRVAILSFDSHLKIWTDFTNDRAHLDRGLAHGMLFERPRAVPPSPGPSLGTRLDAGAARRAYGIERALELIGHALEPLPGSKSLVLVGHGFGRFGATGVAMENDYAPARRALVSARTAVFSLDVSDADYHSLEAGLQLVAEDTGGFYARTHLFPARAMRRLSGALAGYYVLFVDAPGRERGAQDLRVDLTRSTGHVLARRRYADRK